MLSAVTPPLGWLRRYGFGLCAVVVLVGLGGAAARTVQQDLAQPRSLSASSYVGSRACQSCHPLHYDSFHQTFHRTMTQDASEASVLGHFDGTHLDYMGVRAVMQRGAHGEYLMSFSSASGGQRWRAQVERCVGSHRYQQYLAREGSVSFRLPIAWDVGERRFIHMNAAFLTPDPVPTAADGGIERADYDRHVTRWNDNCVFCHNVHPNPGLNETTGEFSTRVAELGVACEACHGPGAEHVALNSSPLRRYALHAFSRADPSIRDPARMPAARSAQVCGRCHGQRITRDIGQLERHGDPFIPGDDLTRISKPLARDTLQNGEPGLFEARFWSDGTPRLTAYEYQGYLQSPCARSASFSCESCHAMHAGDPTGQLRPDRPGDQICTSCHTQLATPLMAAQHSRHTLGSTGTRCVACHMPQLVYGLVSVRLSHRIEVPRPARQADDARPDACTLCHVDRTRAWARQATHAQPSAASDANASTQLSEQAYRLLAGDPVERAVAAHALGEPRAQYAASYRPQLLGLLIDAAQADAYPAVRSIASRALRDVLAVQRPQTSTHFANYSATESPTQRAAALASMIEGLQPGAVQAPDPALSARLRSQANDVAIEIGE